MEGLADVILANLGTLVSVGLLILVGTGMIGLMLILRDEQRARRASRDETPEPED